MSINISKYIKETPLLQDIVDTKPSVWVNPNMVTDQEIWDIVPYTQKDIEEADEDLHRFAPLIEKVFPETKDTNGIIESPLKYIPNMAERIAKDHEFYGDLYLKMDNELPIAGSVKARGGIYEVLKHAEDLALEHGLIDSKEDDYKKLATSEAKDFYSQYKIQVGSTGNLGLSIGISSAIIGFEAIVHMSSDAKQWKKDLLREKGATVIEYKTDYGAAVAEGRENSDADPKSYFIDDENSELLFKGYSVSAIRTAQQLKEQNINVDENNPLFIYIPCGVGGAPGGIAFGFKKIFGDAAHIFFVEPNQVPSVLLGMATGLNDKISVFDIELTGKTEADGLAVQRPSGFVGGVMEPMLSGIFTIADSELFNYMRDLVETENIQIEPSSCATFEGPAKLFKYKATRQYIKDHGLESKKDSITHIGWATGGNLVPDEIMKENLNTYL